MNLVKPVYRALSGAPIAVERPLTETGSLVLIRSTRTEGADPADIPEVIEPADPIARLEIKVDRVAAEVRILADTITEHGETLGRVEDGLREVLTALIALGQKEQGR